MRIAYTDRFRRAYAALVDRDAERVRKALGLLAVDPRHPGLRVKKMQGTERIWEARASKSLRITFEVEGDWILLRNVGAHDATLRRP
jgi:mRNA-degrading endonuclease RelE of RelBE toxin-antitoxin system